jgi:hypothetical protein
MSEMNTAVILNRENVRTTWAKDCQKTADSFLRDFQKQFYSMSPRSG